MYGNKLSQFYVLYRHVSNKNMPRSISYLVFVRKGKIQVLEVLLQLPFVGLTHRLPDALGDVSVDVVLQGRQLKIRIVVSIGQYLLLLQVRLITKY